jgi:hypothetical protein
MRAICLNVIFILSLSFCAGFPGLVYFVSGLADWLLCASPARRRGYDHGKLLVQVSA